MSVGSAWMLPAWTVAAALVVGGLLGGLLFARFRRRDQNPSWRPTNAAPGRIRAVSTVGPDGPDGPDAVLRPTHVPTRNPDWDVQRPPPRRWDSGDTAVSEAEVQKIAGEVRDLKRMTTERLEDVEDRLRALESGRAAPVASAAGQPARSGGGASLGFEPYEVTEYVPGSGVGIGATVAEVAALPPDAVGAEVRDDMVRETQSYPPEAFLARGSPARLFLNPDVQMSEAAIRRFLAFFDFPSTQSGFFRTTRPADVEWSDGKGTCRGRGTVEAA